MADHPLVMALHAAISRRSWNAVEQAANKIRDCGLKDDRPSTSSMHDLISAIIQDDASYDAATNTWDTAKAASAIIAAFDGESTLSNGE